MPSRALKVLDFDIENRPISYGGSDFTFGEITAIAACWTGKPETLRVWLLGRDDPKHMHAGFYQMYAQADLVTGHYIRNHDLPAITGERLVYGMPPLPPKMTCDTKNDLIARGLVSHSQENLAAYLGIPVKKYHMSEADWRQANQLTPAGIELTRKRATSDVVQHMAMRRVLIERGLLGSPKTWRP